MYELIKKWEGLRLEAYKCSAGKWTIGYGTTIYPGGTKVKKGDTCTKEEAEGLLLWYCTTKIKLPENIHVYNQKEALYSLIYNIGQTSFDASKCKKAIEAGDWQTAYANWDWNKVRDPKTGKLKFSQGLENRRQDERKLFFEGLIK